VLGLADALYPNTAASVLWLAAASLAVAAVGTGCGRLARRLAGGPPRPAASGGVLSAGDSCRLGRVGRPGS